MADVSEKAKLAKETPEQRFEEDLKQAYEEWKAKAEAKTDNSKKYVTVSSALVKPLYTPEDVEHIDFVNVKDIKIGSADSGFTCSSIK